MQARRRLHRDQANELYQVVLHHVAECADLVVELDPTADAEILGDRDLHVVDRAASPQRLEQRVRETQGEEVLHGLLAQVMIDPEDPVLRKTPPHFVVDRAGRRVVVAERFLQHDAALCRQESVILQARRDGPEQGRRGREIGDTDPVVEAGEQFHEFAPRVVIERIGLHVVDALPQARPVIAVEFAGREVVPERLFDELQVGIAGEIAAARRDDTAVTRDLAVALTVV